MNYQQPKNRESGDSGKGTVDTKLQHLVTTLTRAVLRHESDLAMCRADTSFVIFVDTGSHSCLQQLKDAGSRWQETYTQGTVKRPLKQFLMLGIFKTLKEQMEALLTDDAKMERCRQAGWLTEGRAALDDLEVSYLGPGAEVRGARPDGSAVAERDGVILRFKATKDMESADDPLHGFDQPPHPGSSRSSLGMCLYQAGKGSALPDESPSGTSLLGGGFLRWSNRDQQWSRGRA